MTAYAEAVSLHLCSRTFGKLRLAGYCHIAPCQCPKVICDAQCCCDTWRCTVPDQGRGYIPAHHNGTAALSAGSTARWAGVHP